MFDKDLGMEGYPAEYGMYLSIIKSNKLHKSVRKDINL